MKRILTIIAVIAIAFTSFQSNAYLADGTVIAISASDIVQVEPADSAVYLDIKPAGNNIEVIVHNIVPQQWWVGSVSSVPVIVVVYKQQNSRLLFDIGADYFAHSCDSDIPHFTTPPYFDFKFTIPDVSWGAYSLEMFFDLFNMDRVTVSESLLINESSSTVKISNKPSVDIVREGVEWVLYQPEPDNRVKFYRMQFKGKADVFFAGEGETVKDASRLFLYTDATLDEERDPVIAYFKPSGPLNARRIAADTDIPVGFWASWGTAPPCETINPYRLFRDSGDVSRLMSLVGENFTLSQLPEEEKGDAKWYWEDYISGTMRPMFKQAYIDETEDSGTPRYALTMSENMDGTGYRGRWESGVGPVGEDYASNLPYPVYSLKRGMVPTALLYVRDINTNEILWGDPKLDPAYNSVGDIAEEPAAEVYGGDGVIEVRGEGNVRIYTLSGVLAGSVEAPSTLSVSPGLYIAVSGTQSKKIIVR